MSRSEAIRLVDDAFKESWNTHTSVQMDGNVRDVLYDVVEKILERIEKKTKEK